VEMSNDTASVLDALRIIGRAPKYRIDDKWTSAPSMVLGSAAAGFQLPF
jgi:hypothetical protein